MQGTDQDARRRRAALGEDGDGEAPEFDLAALFPGAAMAGDGPDRDGEDASADEEEHVARAYAAQRLLDGSQVSALSIPDSASRFCLSLFYRACC